MPTPQEYKVSFFKHRPTEADPYALEERTIIAEQGSFVFVPISLRGNSVTSKNELFKAYVHAVAERDAFKIVIPDTLMTPILYVQDPKYKTMEEAEKDAITLGNQWETEHQPDYEDINPNNRKTIRWSLMTKKQSKKVKPYPETLEGLKKDLEDLNHPLHPYMKPLLDKHSKEVFKSSTRDPNIPLLYNGKEMSLKDACYQACYDYLVNELAFPLQHKDRINITETYPAATKEFILLRSKFAAHYKIRTDFFPTKVIKHDSQKEFKDFCQQIMDPKGMNSRLGGFTTECSLDQYNQLIKEHLPAIIDIVRRSPTLVSYFLMISLRLAAFKDAFEIDSLNCMLGETLTYAPTYTVTKTADPNHPDRVIFNDQLSFNPTH